MVILLGLVAKKNVPLAAERLQPVSHVKRQLEQRARTQPWLLLDVGIPPVSG